LPSSRHWKAAESAPAPWAGKQKEMKLMRMVRRLALYVGLVVVAAILAIAAGLVAVALGIASDAARWVGLGVLVVCLGVIVYFMEFRRP
jgi:uncharacterized membrane protein HdeD (DUF308 family)